MNNWRMTLCVGLAMGVSAQAQWLNYPTAGVPRLRDNEKDAKHLVGR
jgi:hypothetical protein